jgi:peptidyl-prolyl cis-trans isomerase D
MEKLNGPKGSLEEVAAKYGPEAQVRTASNVTFGSGTIEGAGMEPVAVGKIFGLKPGKRTNAIEGQGGVLMAELQQITPAPAPADLAGLKKQIQMSRAGVLIMQCTKPSKRVPISKIPA